MEEEINRRANVIRFAMLKSEQTTGCSKDWRAFLPPEFFWPSVHFNSCNKPSVTFHVSERANDD